MTTIIRNIRIVLLITIPFRYLEGRGYPELRRKVRSIKELNRKIKEVRLEKIDKDTELKSGPLTLIFVTNFIQTITLGILD